MATTEPFKPHSQYMLDLDDEDSNVLGYSRLLKSSSRIHEIILPYLLKAVDRIPYDRASPFTICCYGAADGGNAIPLIRCVTEKIKNKYGTTTPVQIVYEDQPCNDFNLLLKRANGIKDQERYFMHDHENVYVFTSGTNFYSQCLPDHHLHLGFSVSSMHWLSKRPGSLSRITHNLVGQEESEIWKKAAAKDWETILLNRAAEMKSGSELLLANFSTDVSGQYLLNIHGSEKFPIFLEGVLDQLLAYETISKTERQDIVLIEYLRTKEEHRQPFEEPDSPVNRAGLRLVSIETVYADNELHNAMRSAVRDGSASETEVEKYVEGLGKVFRLILSGTILSGLDKERTYMEKKNILDAFFDVFVRKFKQNFHKYSFCYVHDIVHIRKE